MKGQRTVTYKIKYGDTLTSIAKSFNTTVDAIAGANNIKNKNLIYAGDTLYIPDVSSSASAPAGSVRTVSGGGVILGGDESAAKKAAQSVESWEKRRPTEYKDNYAAKIDSLLSALSSRKFSYDPEKDPSYIKYRDKYLADALLAMEDAAGAASAKTGGYSNSYAQAVGNQAFGKYMQDFSQILPELYEAAYDRYSDEGDDLISRIKLISSLSDEQWDRYNDALKNYLSEGKMLTDNYSKLSKEDAENYLKYLEIMKKYS